MSGAESAGQYVTGKWVAGQRAMSDAAASWWTVLKPVRRRSGRLKVEGVFRPVWEPALRLQSFLTDGPRSMLKASPLSGVWGPAPGLKPTPLGHGATECSTTASKACERGLPVARREHADNRIKRAKPVSSATKEGLETGGRRQAAAASIKARQATSIPACCNKPPETAPNEVNPLSGFFRFYLLPQTLEKRDSEYGHWTKKNSFRQRQITAGKKGLLSASESPFFCEVCQIFKETSESWM
jgi:hypothetical protein